MEESSNSNVVTQNKQSLLEQNIMMNFGGLVLQNIKLDTELQWTQMQLNSMTSSTPEENEDKKDDENK